MERIIYQKTANYEENHWWFVGRRLIVEHMLSRLPLKPTAKILEIGSGTGGNLQLLSRYGQVFGLEMDDDARSLAMQKCNSPILPGSLPYDIPFSGVLFDLIIMMDVLEHVEEDEKSLIEIRKNLKNDGYTFITVPAFQFLWSKHDELHHHKRRYTKATLKNKLLSAGYNILIMTYFNTFLFPVIAGMRVLKRFIKIKGEDDLTMPPVFLNNILGNIFGSERRLLPFFPLPFGVSLLAVAQKLN